MNEVKKFFLLEKIIMIDEVIYSLEELMSTNSKMQLQSKYLLRLKGMHFLSFDDSDTVLVQFSDYEENEDQWYTHTAY